MKKPIAMRLWAAVAVTLLPVLPALAAHEKQPAQLAQELEFVEFTMESGTPDKETEQAGYLVLDVATGEVLSVSVRDYLIGAVAAEMPASFAPEALKAQAVAAHTYAQRLVLLAQGTADASLKGAHFSNDSSRFQAFYTDAQMQEVFGEQYAEVHKKIAAAVDAVSAELLLYDAQPIVAAFHAMSSGKTESAAHVWGEHLPYLVAVDSSTDCDAPLFEQTAAFSAQEVQTMLSQEREDLWLGNAPENWLVIAETSDSGTVLRLNAGNAFFTGQEIRRIFSLRSAAFTVDYADGKFTFTTKGYGHNVGMSQYGANAMANAGSTYRDILAHYYPQAVLGMESQP